MGLGSVQTGSRGIAIIFLFNYKIAFVRDYSGVSALDFPYEIRPFPLPMKSRVL